MGFETVVLIPNFNGINHLKECLPSLYNQSYSNFKVVLVDNCSNDGSVNLVKGNFLDTDVLSLRKNYGFSSSMNKGIIYSIKKYDPKYIALLNNDTVVDKDWLACLVDSIMGDGEVAAVNSNILFYDNHNLVCSHGGNFNFIGDGKDINIFNNISKIKKFPCEILYPSASAIILRSSFLKTIGFFDSRYFAYSEDLDWGWRANLYGYKIIFERKSIAYHKLNSTFKKTPSIRYYLCKRNSLCSLLKNYEFSNLIKVLPLLLLNYISYPVWIITRKNISLKEKFKSIFIPLRAILWNILNIGKTLEFRREIQLKRVIPDSEIIELGLRNNAV